MEKIYVLIDVGCHECGVGSEFIASFVDEESANKACEEHSKKTGKWRDGGQSIPEVFEIILPNHETIT